MDQIQIKPHTQLFVSFFEIPTAHVHTQLLPRDSMCVHALHAAQAQHLAVALAFPVPPLPRLRLLAAACLPASARTEE